MKRKIRGSASIVATLAIAVAAMLPGGCSKNDDVYIPVVSKGLQHEFWQTVKSGAEDAARQYRVTITFEGPVTEADVEDQVHMLQSALANHPDAIALAALDTGAVTDQLREAIRRKIPVIGFDSGVPNAPKGSIYANASTDNYAAAGIAADAMFAKIRDRVVAATAASPVEIVVMSQDATGESVLSRGKGFRDRLIELVMAQGGKTAHDIRVTGNPSYIAPDSPTEGEAVIIKMVVSSSPRPGDATAAANAVLSRVVLDHIVGVFCSNEGMAVGLLNATNGGVRLASDFGGLVVIGFDAGAAQKNAVREGYFLGSVTQDPYEIGFKAVELAYRASKGEPVSSVDTGAKFYDASNMDDPSISRLLYD